MEWTSIIAIYALIWVLSAFLVMPFGVRTHDVDDDVDKVPGQADSAPVEFRPGKVVLRATVLAAVLFGLYYVIYVNGWIVADDLNFFGGPPGYASETG